MKINGQNVEYMHPPYLYQGAHGKNWMAGETCARIAELTCLHVGELNPANDWHLYISTPIYTCSNKSESI